MAGEFQNLGNALKIVYPSKALEAIVQEETPFRSGVSKNLPAGGRVSEGELKFNGVLALPQNVSQIFDGGDLIDAGERVEVQFTLKPTIFQSTMNIGWLTKAAADSNKSAFNGGETRRRTEETAGNIGKFIEQTYLSTFGTGVRGYVESSSVAGIVIKQVEGTNMLPQGLKISVRDGATPTTIRATLDGVRVASNTVDTRLITTTGTPTYTNAVLNDIVVPVPAASQILVALYANGVRGLIDDGTYLESIHGVSRTTYPKLKSYIAGNGGTLRSLNEQILIRAFHEVRKRTGKRVTDLWLGAGQVEKYIEFVAPDRRRAVSGGNYDKSTGYKGTQEFKHYAPGVDVTFNFSFDVLPREMFGFNWDSWFHYVARPLDWITDDQLLHLAIGTGTYKARWDAFMASFENIGCDMPAAQIAFRDLKDPSIGDV